VCALLLLALTAAPAVARAWCSFNTGALSFGSYNPLSSAPTDANATITVSCLLQGATTLRISMSPGRSGNARDRRMAAGTSELRYNVYVDAARSTVLGDGTNGTQRRSVAIPATLWGQQTVTAYGRVLPLQSVAAGGYADTLVVTYEF
jgi:spore coat protein U-like protein